MFNPAELSIIRHALLERRENLLKVLVENRPRTELAVAFENKIRSQIDEIIQVLDSVSEASLYDETD